MRNDLHLRSNVDEPITRLSGVLYLVVPCFSTDVTHLDLNCQSMECSWVSKFPCGVASASKVDSH